MQRQLVCNGCRSVLLYLSGATNRQLVCNGCRSVLLYLSGATNVCCAICNNITVVPPPVNRVAHLSCAHCHTMLVFPYGARTVKCAICHFVMNIGMNSTSTPIPAACRPNEIMPVPPSTSSHASQTQNTTIVVENPMSVDKSGKLATNLLVGVTTGKK